VSGGAVSEKLPTNHDRGDVSTVQGADAGAAVVRAFAIQLAPKRVVLDQMVMACVAQTRTV
jgi:hypothetical protein